MTKSRLARDFTVEACPCDDFGIPMLRHGARFQWSEIPMMLLYGTFSTGSLLRQDGDLYVVVGGVIHRVEDDPAFTVELSKITHKSKLVKRGSDERISRRDTTGKEGTTVSNDG